MLQTIWATFVSKFGVNIFKKYPNPITLAAGRSMRERYLARFASVLIERLKLHLGT